MGQKKLIHEWILPKGDVYEIWQSTGKGMLSFKAYVRRELETTLCCHGTNSMATIKQYYKDVKLAQQDVMNDRRNGKLHAYWVAYKKRRLSCSTPLNSQGHTHTSTSTSHHTTLDHTSQTIAARLEHISSKASKANGKRVSFLC